MVESDPHSPMIHEKTAPPARVYVRVMAIGHETTVDRLRRKMPHWCTLQPSGSVADAIEAMRTRKCEFVALDPSSLHVDLMIDAAIAAEQHGVGCLLYATLGRRTANQVIGVMAKARCELIFIGGTEEAFLLARCFRSSSRISAAALVTGELAPRLLQLPNDIGETIVGEFGGASRTIRESAPSSSTRSEKRQIQRACEKAGLAAPARLLAGRWIANSWNALREGRQISEIVLRHGWGSADRFRANFRRLVGVSPSAARKRLNTGEFASQLAASLKRRP